MGFPTACCHVYGHQDARQRKKQLKDKKEKKKEAKEHSRGDNTPGRKQQARPRTVSEDAGKDDHNVPP